MVFTNIQTTYYWKKEWREIVDAISRPCWHDLVSYCLFSMQIILPFTEEYGLGELRLGIEPGIVWGKVKISDPHWRLHCHQRSFNWPGDPNHWIYAKENQEIDISEVVKTVGSQVKVPSFFCSAKVFRTKYYAISLMNTSWTYVHYRPAI